MAPPESLIALRSRISDLGQDALLAMPIGEVRGALPDPEVGNIVGYVAEHLGLRTFGDLLESREAQRVLSGALDGENQAWVLGTLAQWVSQDDHAPRRYVPDPPPELPSPGRKAEEVERWAVEHGVSRFLDAPARLISPFVEPADLWKRASHDGVATVGDYLRRERLPDPIGRRSTVALHLADAARAFLVYQARRRAQDLGRRERLARRPQAPRMRMLAARLEEALREGSVDPMRSPPRLDTPGAVILDPDPPSLRCHFARPRGLAPGKEIETRVALSGFESRKLPVACSCSADPAIVGATESERCTHRETLLGYALDALHDPKHTLHQALETVAMVPTWRRLVDAASRTLDADPHTSPDHPERLVWRLSRDGERPLLQPAIQRKGKRGRFSPGSATTIDRVAAREDLVDAHDRPLVDALLGLSDRSGARLSPNARAAREAMALRALVGHRRIFAADAPDRPLTIESATMELALLPSHGEHVLVFRISKESVDAREVAESSILLRHDQLRDHSFVCEVDAEVRAFAETVRDYPARVPPEAIDELLLLLPRLQPSLSLSIPPALAGRERESAGRPVVRLSPLEEGGIEIGFRSRPLPGGASWPTGHGPEQAFGIVDGERCFARRDLDAEWKALEWLRGRLGLHEPLERGGTSVVVEDPDDALAALEELRSLGDAVEIEWPSDARPIRLERPMGASALEVRVTRARDWFAVDGEAPADRGRVSLTQLLRAARQGRRYVKIGKGRFARLERDLVARLRGIDALVFDTEEGARVGRAAAPRLMDIAGGKEHVTGDAAFEGLIERIAEAEELEPTPPAELDAELRTYQLEGFRWMARLASWQGGGILADEMGLGKTVQALALLLRHREDGPSMVVTPTSVLGNWKSEAERFAKPLHVIVHHGPDRHGGLDDAGAGDLILTSYDLLARDLEIFRRLDLTCLILDEAQAVKNARTRRARAARAIAAEFRFALTGTPVENHLAELFSLFDVVSPGLLGSQAHFHRHYALPIERDGDLDRRRELEKRIRPFVLRRTKDQVAPELPPRTEVVRVVELSEAERRLYDGARREALEQLEGDGGAPKSDRRFDVLAALTRLRLLACHPRLVHPTSLVSSSKLEAFAELIEELLEEGEHRALIFSQFTRHLALVRERLDLMGIDSLYLDGSTPETERRRLVSRFQEGRSPFFLISLKAGGSGLNLTAADYVIHLDPWWNPATEDQASDRAHRIGQDRPVTVVRLISQDTVEQTVLALHERKRALLDEVLAGGDSPGKASAAELVSLIREAGGAESEG